MARESKEEEPVEAPPEIKPKLTLVVLLSALIGIFLTLLTVGAIYHFQSGKAVENELAVSKEEVRRKTLMLTEAQEQVTALSKQVHALREFSIARASGAAEEAIVAGKQPTQAATPAATPAPASPDSEALKKEAAPPPVVKKAKPAGLDCQLVGKSAEEQMATLQRCTKAMDGKK
jgi:hypothetical protein